MTEHKRTVALSDSNFESQIAESQIPVLVDFWADWCGPCHMIAPIIEELAEEMHGHLKVCKLDVDENPHTSARYGIRSIPNLLLFRDGKVVHQIIGAVPKTEILKQISPLVNRVET